MSAKTELRSQSTSIVELVNEGHGELHARRVTGLTVAESEEIFTRTESVARWSRERRAAYEAEKKTPLFGLFLL